MIGVSFILADFSQSLGWHVAVALDQMEFLKVLATLIFGCAMIPLFACCLRRWRQYLKDKAEQELGPSLRDGLLETQLFVSPPKLLPLDTASEFHKESKFCPEEDCSPFASEEESFAALKEALSLTDEVYEEVKPLIQALRRLIADRDSRKGCECPSLARNCVPIRKEGSLPNQYLTSGPLDLHAHSAANPPKLKEGWLLTLLFGRSDEKSEGAGSFLSDDASFDSLVGKDGSARLRTAAGRHPLHIADMHDLLHIHCAITDVDHWVLPELTLVFSVLGEMDRLIQGQTRLMRAASNVAVDVGPKMLLMHASGKAFVCLVGGKVIFPPYLLFLTTKVTAGLLAGKYGRRFKERLLRHEEKVFSQLVADSVAALAKARCAVGDLTQLSRERQSRLACDDRRYERAKRALENGWITRRGIFYFGLLATNQTLLLRLPDEERGALQQFPCFWGERFAITPNVFKRRLIRAHFLERRRRLEAATQRIQELAPNTGPCSNVVEFTAGVQDLPIFQPVFQALIETRDALDARTSKFQVLAKKLYAAQADRFTYSYKVALETFTENCDTVVSLCGEVKAQRQRLIAEARALGRKVS